ncbi:MAG: hypothetical protein JWN14_4124 [Chthonomonadales bacterium]|nr:hypothetical protein [Chthonomonadales bacterium]
MQSLRDRLGIAVENRSSRLKHRASRRKVLIGLGVGGLVIVGLISWRWTVTMKAPVLTIPNPVMPNPNAYDFYVTAGKGIVNQKLIDDSNRPIPTFEPAVQFPGGAGEGPSPDAVRPPPTMPMTLKQRATLVQQNAGVIAQVHQGFEHPYLQPPCRTMDADFHYTKLRDLARLLELQGRVRSEKGDWNGAADSYLDVMRMGEDIPHGATLGGALTGTYCQTVGRRPLWKVVEHLNAPQSHATLQRLASILERHLPFVDTLQEEKWLGQSLRLEIFRDARMRGSLFLPGDTEGDPLNTLGKSLSGCVFLVYSKNRIMHDFTHYMDQGAQMARQPYALHRQELPEPTDPINKVLLPIWTRARWEDVHCETQNDLLLVTLALHAYRLERGHYPAFLAELAPAYLQKPPDDQCAAQGTFQYHLKGSDYVLYSVGPDGKDDGGTPIDDPKNASKTHPQRRYQVRMESVGDIVAGINVP